MVNATDTSNLGSKTIHFQLILFTKPLNTVFSLELSQIVKFVI